MSANPTSITDFQECLIEKISEILSDTTFQKADGTTVTGATGYNQQLPRLVLDDDDTDQFFPYYLVRVTTGKAKSDNEPWEVTVDILLGCYSDDTVNDGHTQIAGMITAITDYFVAYPLLDRKYRALQEFEFAMQDEDTYPYFFGGIEMKFWVQRARREDKYA